MKQAVDRSKKGLPPTWTTPECNCGSCVRARFAPKVLQGTVPCFFSPCGYRMVAQFQYESV